MSNAEIDSWGHIRIIKGVFLQRSSRDDQKQYTWDII